VVVLEPLKLRSSPAPSLDQALREAPFVLVRQNARGEMELSIRGSDSRQAAVLLDGVPITLGWDHRTDPSLIPVTSASRIAITRGLGSLLAGPNTLGGIIEITHDDLGETGGRTWGGLGTDQFGSWVVSAGAARRVETSRLGTWSFRSGLAHRDRPGIALAAGAPDPTAKDDLRTNTDLRQSDAFASARWSGAQGATVGVSFTGYDAERGVPPEEHVTAPRLWRNPYNTRGLATLSAQTGTRRTPFGYMSLALGAGLNSHRLKIQAFRDRRYQQVTAEELGNEKTLTSRALLTHSLARGASLRVGYAGADVRYVETLSPLAGVDYRQRLSSIGVEVDQPVGSRLTLTGGFVRDRTTTPETGGRLPAQRPFDANGWRFGATHLLASGWQAHGSFSQRSRFPSLRELYSGALDRFQPNPDLKPERLNAVDAGVTMAQARGTTRTTLQVTGFRQRLDDAVVRVTLANPLRFKRINRDRMEISGAELLGGLSFGADTARAVTVSGDATFQSISILDQAANAQRRAENNPETRLGAEFGAPSKWRSRVVLAAHYTGEQYCLNPAGGDLTVKAATRADLAWTRDFRARAGMLLRALLALDNVGNTLVYDQCGLPQPGRTLRVMFTVR
jgi:iron complex outermembrane receptor protein